MRLFDNYFWGILFIAAGVIFLLKHFFNIQIPVGRTIIAFILIYSGLVVAFGGYDNKTDTNIIFDNGNIKASDTETAKAEYNIIFGQGTVDLTGVIPTVRRQKVDVNAIFASGTVFIDSGTPYVIKASSAFASARLPDGTHTGFGDNTYRSRNFKEDMPYLEIEANAVFGKLEIVER